MLGITYEIWKDICKMYLDLKPNTLAAYLQWFPFTKLSMKHKEELLNEDFYHKYIETMAFVTSEAAMLRTENFILKKDGAFRNSSLLSPILYLLLQSVGKIVSEKYVQQRSHLTKVYYGGDYIGMDPTYKSEYDSFFKEVNSYADGCNFFIKTDIANFFDNININILIEQIDAVCNSSELKFTQVQLQLYKKMLEYCGAGKFPLVENSMCSSYLATVVYLDQIDKAIHEFLVQNNELFSNFHVVRYVDDLYILFSFRGLDSDRSNLYNLFMNVYSNILHEYGLSVNRSKCCIKPTKDINEELKKSLYDEYFNGKKKFIAEQFKNSVPQFILQLSEAVNRNQLDVEKYNSLIIENFSDENIEFTPNEVLNYFVYENQGVFKDKIIRKAIENMVHQNMYFISIDPKRLTTILTLTRDGDILKLLLCNLFAHDRSGMWVIYDSIIAITYLIQRKFTHKDLCNVLNKRCPGLSLYYKTACAESFLSSFLVGRNRIMDNVIKTDQKAYYLFFMYVYFAQRSDALESYAYFKTFFDRVTADIDYEYKDITCSKSKKANYSGFYKEKQLITFYADVVGSRDLILKAQKLRNANPINHSSAELLNGTYERQDLINSIDSLSEMLTNKMIIMMYKRLSN